MLRAYDFARSYIGWIDSKINDLPLPQPFVHGQSIPILNKQRHIRIHYNENLKRTSIALNDDALEIHTNKEDPSQRICRYLKTLAHDSFLPLCREKAAQIGQIVQSLSLRDTKSRWGSCSHDGHLSLSWRLIFAPYEAYDYVIAHEVAHLRHLNHSEKFWALCEELSTDFSTGHRWMKRHGQMLHTYGQIYEQH